MIFQWGMNMNHKKSQSVVFDLFIALFIFVLITSIISIMWNKYNFQINDQVHQKEMLIKNYHITDLFVESRGSPENWHEDFNSIDILGFTERDGYLSYDKLDGFINFSLSEDMNLSWSNHSDGYDLVKELLNIEGFEFYFRVFNLLGENIFESGRSPIFYGDLISGSTISTRRYVSLNECEKCILEFSIWEWE